MKFDQSNISISYIIKTFDVIVNSLFIRAPSLFLEIMIEYLYFIIVFI